MDKYEEHMKGSLKEEVLDFMLDTILEAAGTKRAKLMRSLIPPVPSKLKKAKEMGGTFAYRNRDIVKSPKWLEKHGLCVDNLRSGKSTVPHAGRGAFASRKLTEGDIIAPVPMIPIFAEELLDMYKVVEHTIEGAKAGLTYDRSNPMGTQLLLNYCFGHVESSILMIPSSPMVSLINHSPEPNAFLTWSTHDWVENDHPLHDLPLDQWDFEKATEKDPKLVMVLVASKDIEEGEEVFINYGPLWETAWEEHVRNFKDAHSDGTWPLKAEDVRKAYKHEPYPVDVKKRKMPYPNGVFTACFVETMDVEDGEPKRNSAGNEIMNWAGPESYGDYLGNNLVVCDLQSRQESEEHFYTYTVITRLKESEDVIEVKNVPHAAILLMDKPYTSDALAPGVFRHWIAIEDEKFPQAWRNLR
jgi:hypothetical protein